MTAVIWPFAPRDEMVEAVEWATDVIRTKASEQRIALRAEPRSLVEFRHAFSPSAFTHAQSLIEVVADSTLQIPDWAQAVALTAAPAPGTTTLTLDTIGRGFVVGGAALLRAGETYESVTVSAVTATTLTVSATTRTYTSAPLVMPLRTGRPVGGLRGSRVGAGLVNAQAQFEFIDAGDTTEASDLPVYLGTDVMTEVPLIGSGVEAGTEREVERMENVAGVDFVVATYKQASRRFSLSWHEFTRAEILRMRRLIASRRGKQKQFWLPTHEADLVPAADITASSTTLYVLGNTLPTGTPASLHIMFRTHTGAQLFRRVTAVANDALGQALTLDAALNTALTAAQMTVSLLVLARFDSDRIEYLHRTGLGVSARMPCVSVPT